MRKLQIKTLAAHTGGGGGIYYKDPGSTETGTTGTCPRTECMTTLTGPLGVECCCLYACPSGNTWVCRQGSYCAA